MTAGRVGLCTGFYTTCFSPGAAWGAGSQPPAVGGRIEGGVGGACRGGCAEGVLLVLSAYVQTRVLNTPSLSLKSKVKA